MKFSLTSCNKIFVFMIFCAARAKACDLDEIENAVNNNSYQAAYSLVLECEASSDVTGPELAQLAGFYTRPGLRDFLSDEVRGAKFYELLTRSSLTGERDSIQSLLGNITYGDHFLAIEPDPVKAECLQQLVDGPGDIQPGAVKKCLGGDEALKLLIPNYAP